MLAHVARGNAADLLCTQGDASRALDVVAQRAQAGPVDAPGGGEGIHPFQRRGQRRSHFAPDLADQFAQGIGGAELIGEIGAVAGFAWAGV